MSGKPVILIVDDEKNTREGLVRALRGEYAVAEADNGLQALEWLDTHAADVVLSDLRMPGMDGLALLSRLLAREPRPVLILLTAYGSIETAVEAMKRGAYDFLSKPVNLDRLDLLLKRALAERRLDAENRRLKEQLDSKFGFENIIGASAPMQEVFDTIRQAAPSRATVLIQGESGTGKELVARALHQCSPRAQGPFVPVHCAALAPTLLESELFGHEKGAFTGALAERKGRFELAHGGSLLLDEIGDIPPAIQIKLLRVLQEREFERVGGTRTIKVDVRVIAATNKDLQALVQQGRFREDLYYRLHVFPIWVPPLRKRKADIVLLADHFLQKYAKENGKDVRRLSSAVIDMLMIYHWPGNVRELENCIERAVLVAEGSVIHPYHLPPTLQTAEASGTVGDVSLADAVAAYEKSLIQDALKTARGNASRAAKLLHSTERIISYKIRKLGIERERFRG